MTVWRDLQGQADLLNKKRRWQKVRVMGLDGAYPLGWGKKHPVLVAVDLGNGQLVAISGWSLGHSPDYFCDFFASWQGNVNGNNTGGYSNPIFDANCTGFYSATGWRTAAWPSHSAFFRSAFCGLAGKAIARQSV